ncbi:MAG: hypothetical protein ACRDS0_37500 [Pseudonocardiaceae bacterium]
MRITGPGGHLRLRTVHGVPRQRLHRPASRVAAMTTTDSPDVVIDWPT